MGRRRPPAPLVEEYGERVEGFSAEEAATVEHHTSSEVRREYPNQSEADRIRGVTTALPQELGRNLPLLEWCAHLRLGDYDLSTKEIRRVRPLGGFHNRPVRERSRRQLRETNATAKELTAVASHPSGPSESETLPEGLTDSKKAFVRQYAG